MKKFLLLGLTALVFQASQGQGTDLARQDPPMHQSPLYMASGANQQQWMLNETERYKRMRNTGKVLTYSGIGLMAAGGILIASSDKSGPFSSWDGQAIAGSVGLIAGALSTTGGIILWSKGNKKLREGGTSLQINANGSVGLAYKF